MRLLLATANAHKIGELGAILGASGIGAEVWPASAVGGMPEVDEDAPAFEGNARKKALALQARAAGLWAVEETPWLAVADDSGLCVDALGGGPGVRSARFAGAGAGDAANTRKLLERLSGVPAARRGAAFRCCIVAAAPDGATAVFEGACRGRILEAPAGGGGFGYDPVFVPDGWEKTFAELPSEVKNRISHRARALAALVAWLRAASG
jgi:XTP/dITP diphosphohydrolase